MYTILFIRRVYSDQWESQKVECHSLDIARKIARDVSGNPDVRDVSIWKGLTRINF